MVRRLPSQPPVLPGFSHLHVLGSGGFADVFLYEQNMPRRQVAVKVMLSEVVNDQVRQMFQAEANLMAQLSSHPSILTVYQASVSADGRPYLVMELCSSSLSERYRRERIPVPEILRIAVRIGSAIETAHRAGVLHRDIKPSNILMTAYGHPVLSDFGIASTLSDTDIHETVGMSIPWSAPEVLADESPGSIESEVWSFAATVYSLLAGRSPFEVPGGDNKSSDLMTRINRAKVPPIGRPDVPASLDRALQRAMSRKTADRPASIVELVREFQAIESELGVPQTPIEVAVDDWALGTVDDLEDRTKVRSAAGVATAVRPATRRRRRNAPPLETRSAVAVATSNSAVRNTGSAAMRRRRGNRGLVLGLIGAVVAVVVLAGVATSAIVGGGASDIPQVTDIVADAGNDSVRFTWSDPGLADGDTYQIAANDLDPSIQSAERTSFDVDATPGDRVCITVTVNRDGRTGASSSEKCVDVEGG